MKDLKEFYSNSDSASGPYAGLDKKLFSSANDLLDQGYQTPGETGQAIWRFGNVYPVMKVSLSNNLGDGPSIDSMVDASKEYVDFLSRNSQEVVKKNLSDFLNKK